MWNDSDEGSECEIVQEGLIKVELINRVHRDVDVIMAAVMGPTSKINKEETNNIESWTRSI